MSSDIIIYYAEEPDNEFFEMVGRREFAIENGKVTPDNVEKYFMNNESCADGIKIEIPTTKYYDPDYLSVKFNIDDIPDGIKTIIVEYG